MIILGLVAVILPTIGIMKTNNSRSYPWLSFASFTSCGATLWLVISNHRHLVTIEDWSALMDVSNAFHRISFIFLIVVVALNAYLIRKNNKLPVDEEYFKVRGGDND
jgi:cytochrome c oxidase subunit 4